MFFFSGRVIAMGKGLKQQQEVEMRPVSRKPKQKPVQGSRWNKVLSPLIHLSRTISMCELGGVKLLIATALQKE